MGSPFQQTSTHQPIKMMEKAQDENKSSRVPGAHPNRTHIRSESVPSHSSYCPLSFPAKGLGLSPAFWGLLLVVLPLPRMRQPGLGRAAGSMTGAIVIARRIVTTSEARAERGGLLALDALPGSSPLIVTTLYTRFYSCSHFIIGGNERLSILPNITQLVSGRASFQT